MNSLDYLTYDDQAFINNKTYSIHLLANSGVKQLLEKDSYLRSYLPKVKKVFNEKRIPYKEEQIQEENKIFTREVRIDSRESEKLSQNKSKSVQSKDNIPK